MSTVVVTVVVLKFVSVSKYCFAPLLKSCHRTGGSHRHATGDQVVPMHDDGFQVFLLVLLRVMMV
jgi:hypothetical protein